MRFLSVCSGIEAASVAWSPLGWKAVAFSEIEPFPCAVLAHHYHDTPNWGDMTKYKDWPDVSIDLLCGGTPCQSFSVAGLRKGLDDPRGNLMLTFGAIAAKYRPQWLVWENVPGVLSSNGGRDFGAFLGMLGQLGYGFAYKVCDAQYHGVAQRRRRVFVVGCLGDWHSAAAVLFERHSLQGHPAPRREKGKAAPTIPSRSTAGGGLGTDFDCDGGLVMPTMDQRAGRSGANSFATSGGLVPVPHAAISPALKARDNKGVSSDGDGDGAILVPMLAHSLRGGGFDASEDGTGRGTPLVPCVAGAMSASGGTQKKHGFGWGQQDWENGYCVPVAFDTTQITSPKNVSNPKPGDPCHPLAAGAHAPAIAFPANLSGTQCASTEDLAPSMGAANPTAVAVGVTIHGTHPTVQKIASYDELAQCLRARTPGNIDNSSTTVVQQPVAYGIRTANTSSNGWGIQEECTHTLDCAQGVAVAVALRGREGGATAELGDEVQNCLRASSGGGDKPHVLCETLYNKGFNHGGFYASTQETHAGKILRTLREAVGEEAFAQWGLGILGSLQSPEILRQALHGLSIRPAAFSRSWVVHCALSRSENGSGWLLQSLREAGCERCASQGWEPSEQLAGKLGAYLSELSQPGAQAARLMRDLWFASEGVGLLQQALLAVQEVGRSAGHKGQSVLRGSEGRRAETPEAVPSAGMQCEVSRERVLHQACAAGKARDSREGATEQERSGKGRVGETPFAVRRLTVEECEFLQGFPRGYSKIPWRKKPADQCPDGPRYKALGNSWAVPNVRWIGERIDAVALINKAQAATKDVAELEAA